MANLQVKSIDDDLYRSLGRRAELENRSISQEVIAVLKAHLSTPSSKSGKVSQQFLDLCGTWQGDETAEELVEDIRNSRTKDSTHRDIEF